MSPAVARTTNDAIIAAARALLEADGPDAVTMQAVAARVGVRAPSLYKRFDGRAALMTAVADDVARELAAAVAPVARRTDPARAIRRMAIRYRAFARQSPRSYQLLFGSAGDVATAPTPGTDALAVAGLLQEMAKLVGTADALPAARLLVSFCHGFVSMELAGAFRLGGDVRRAYGYGLAILVRGLAQPTG